ncbi:TRAP transporter small permease [Sneathiella sp.]|uniref:TRAP transporter small permease n=1 Tax=Sneathiella sp. TaxID=1964365 RepID=UPI00263900E7|nr:TRAP transporter small permease [Sneathiella sp.]MDF2367097.1 TRAP transporter small permease [Sneathiella sp.]
MFLMLSISTADVLAYLLLGTPFSGSNEIVEIALAVCIAMAIVYAHYEQSHVKVDIVSENFPIRTKRGVEIIGLFLGTACTTLLAYGAWDLSIASTMERESAITLHSFPIYPWKILFAIGFSIAALESFRQLVMTCLGRPHKLNGRLDIPSQSMKD